MPVVKLNYTLFFDFLWFSLSCYFILLIHLLIICFIILFSRYDSPRETNPPHARRSRNDTSMFPRSKPTARQSETKRPATPQKPANHGCCALKRTHRTRCAPKSRRTESAAHRNRDEPSAPRAEITTNRTTHPLEAWPAQRSATYLS